MQRGFRIGPGSAAKSAEQSEKASPTPRAFRIEGGSAAKSSEDRDHESGAVPRGEFQRSVGIRLNAPLGQKFELPERAAPSPEPARPAPVAAEPSASAAAPAVPGLWNKFRGWFGRG